MLSACGIPEEMVQVGRAERGDDFEHYKLTAKKILIGNTYDTVEFGMMEHFIIRT